MLSQSENKFADLNNCEKESDNFYGKVLNLFTHPPQIQVRPPPNQQALQNKINYNIKFQTKKK